MFDYNFYLKEGIPKLIELNEVVEILEKKIVEKDEAIDNLKIKISQSQKYNFYSKKKNKTSPYIANEI